MKTTEEITNTEDVLDSRDIIARIEELADELGIEDSSDTDVLTSLALALSNGENPLEGKDTEDIQEFVDLCAFRDELQGYGDFHHGETLIRESYFTEYCKDLLWQIGALPKDIPDYLEIDWDKTADNIRVDYTEAEFDGVTYLMRS